MHVLRYAFALGIAASAAIVAGCSPGGSPALRPAASAAQRAPDANARLNYLPKVDALTRLTYISDPQNNLVDVFGRNGVLLGTISDGLSAPLGMFVDAKRNLWVANDGASNVLEFARGATSPSTVLDDTGYTPYDVTICPDGTTYVSNEYAGPSLDPGSISVYAPGSTHPTGLLQYPGQTYNEFLTCDRAGNVFTTVQLSGSSVFGVIEYPGGKQSGATQLPIPLGFAGGIKMDNAGNLLVNDRGPHRVIEYTEAGVATGVSFPTGAGDWVGIAVTRDSRVVVGADAILLKGTSLTMPDGAFRQNYVSRAFGLPFGAAFDPGQKGI